MDQINNHSRVWCPLLDFLFYLTSRCQSMFQLITDFAHFKNKGSFPTCAPLFSLSPWSFLSHLSCLLFFTLSGVKLSPQRSSPGGQSLDKKPFDMKSLKSTEHSERNDGRQIHISAHFVCLFCGVGGGVGGCDVIVPQS